MRKESILTNRKIYKRNRLMEILRCSDQNLSRYDLKKMSGYSMSSILELSREMIEEGLIYEEECEDSRVGRKPAWLRINPDGGYYVGLEFNAQYMNTVVMNLVGTILYKETRETADGVSPHRAKLEQILKQIQDMLEIAQQNVPDRSRIIGIGMGIPGYVDSEKGYSYGYSRIPGWKDIMIRDLVQESTGIPCYIQNNVSVMTLAYKWLNYNGNSNDFVFLSIRTGIRMVTISNNRLVTGKGGFAGEIGHIRISNGGRICSCGRYGCLNSEISDPSLLNIIKEGFQVHHYQRIYELAGENEDNVKIEHYVQAVLEGDEESVKLMKVVAGTLGKALALVVNILAPSEVVLSGKQFEIGEVFLDEIRNAVKEEVIAQNFRNLRIKKSEFGGEIGAIGAACMVMEEYFSYQDMEV